MCFNFMAVLRSFIVFGYDLKKKLKTSRKCNYFNPTRNITDFSSRRPTVRRPKPQTHPALPSGLFMLCMLCFLAITQ